MERWREKPSGFSTVRRGNWWVRPGAAPAPRGGTPRGGTPASTTRTAALNRLIPRDWTGSPGVVGGYVRPPRLDPNAWEVQQNPENNRYFARPRTELTGLDPTARADVAAFDTQGAQQEARIQGAFDRFVEEARANSAATTAGLTGLAGAVGAGYAQADPTAAALAESSRAGAQAASLPVVSRLGDAATIARSEGVSRLQDFIGQRRGQRAEIISGYREQAGEAEAARQERAAELRGQNLEHLGRVLSGQTDVAIATTRANTATQDRLARLEANRQTLQARLEVARQNNETSRANTLTRTLAQTNKAIAKERRKPASASSIRQWAERAREMWDGVPRTVTNEAGERVTEYIQYDASEIIRELIAQGAPRSRAVQIARQITNIPNAGAPLAPGTANATRNLFRGF